MPQDANKYLNQYYPKNRTCLRKDRWWGNNHEDYGKKRAEITQLDLSGEQLTGQLDLSDFIKLEELECFYNQISELILPPSGSLQKLNCARNQLTNLDLSNSVNLTKLWVNDNQLTELDVSNQSRLLELHCSENKLTDLNLSNNKLLKELNFNYNQLTQIDLTGLNQLATIWATNNHLTAFNYEVLNPQTLTFLDIRNNNLATTELSVFSPLVNLVGLGVGNDDKRRINQRQK